MTIELSFTVSVMSPVYVRQYVLAEAHYHFDMLPSLQDRKPP